MHALGEQALPVACRKLGRREAHVAPHAHSQLAHLLAGETGQDVCEGPRDALGDLAVDLLAVDAADVVGLEDRRIDGHGTPS